MQEKEADMDCHVAHLVINYSAPRNDLHLFLSYWFMDTLSLSTSSEAANKLTALVETLADACSQLIDAFAMTFDKVSAYGIKAVQGVFGGVKSLFVDVILIGLKKIELIIAEMKKDGTDRGFSQEYVQSLIDLQKSQLDIRLERHTFFRENFARRVNEIFN